MTVRGLISVPVQSSSAVEVGLVAIVIWPTPLTPVAAPMVTPFEKLPSGINMLVVSSEPVGGGVFDFRLLLMMIAGASIALVGGGAVSATAAVAAENP